MIQATIPAAPRPSAAPPPRPAIQPRSGGKSYIAGLKAKLSIAPDQAHAWKSFAVALCANSCRMETGNERSESPFGPIEHRVTALDAMKRAAQELLAVLSPAQRRAAARVLPLCCLQQSCGDFAQPYFSVQRLSQHQGTAQ